VAFSETAYGEVDLTACFTALNESIAAVHRGELRDAEGILLAQAVALNAVFTELSQRSARTLPRRLDIADRMMRLALKAQGQCVRHSRHWPCYRTRRPCSPVRRM
jgi:hypothetical protein